MSNEISYARTYNGSCLVKFEKTVLGENYVTEVKTQNGRIFLVTYDDNCDIIEEHELGIIEKSPIDLKIGHYGK